MGMVGESRIYVSQNYISLFRAVRVVGFDDDSDTYIIEECDIDESDGLAMERTYTPDEFTGETWYTYEVEVWDADAVDQRENELVRKGAR